MVAMKNPQICVTTINAEMCGFEIANEQDNRYERGGHTTDIYEQTRAVNERCYTLAEFRRRFTADQRRNMIVRYLDPTGEWYASDYTVRDLESRLMEKLRSLPVVA
jgi:hypothetical protein